jgi:hypothetical protein
MNSEFFFFFGFFINNIKKKKKGAGLKNREKRVGKGRVAYQARVIAFLPTLDSDPIRPQL